MMQVQWLQLKMKFLLGYNMKILWRWEGEEGCDKPLKGGIKIWWEESTGGIFCGGENEQMFSMWHNSLPSSFPWFVIKDLSNLNFNSVQISKSGF